MQPTLGRQLYSSDTLGSWPRHLPSLVRPRWTLERRLETGIVPCPRSFVASQTLHEVLHSQFEPGTRWAGCKRKACRLRRWAVAPKKVYDTTKADDAVGSYR